MLMRNRQAFSPVIERSRVSRRVSWDLRSNCGIICSSDSRGRNNSFRCLVRPSIKRFFSNHASSPLRSSEFFLSSLFFSFSLSSSFLLSPKDLHVVASRETTNVAIKLSFYDARTGSMISMVIALYKSDPWPGVSRGLENLCERFRRWLAGRR